MGPKNQYTAHPREFDESDIERTDEYEEFMKQIRAFHEKRGVSATQYTNLEPDIQRKKVDLFKLYKTIIARGGYTEVSTKTGLWKELAVTFNPPQHNTNIGFVLKTIYWKNLAAYECENHWHVDAPPPEAIEHQSAAGSELVGRKPPESIEANSPALLTRGRSGTGETSASTAALTPSGRTLREAPPKRILFQPEVSTPRSRVSLASNQSPGPQPSINGKSATGYSSNANMSDQNNNLPPLPPLSVVAIPTPYSHPHKFLPKGPKTTIVLYRQDVPPGYQGVTDVKRAIMGIHSGLPQEVHDGLQMLLQRSSFSGHAIYFREIPSLGHDLLDLVDKCATAVSSDQVKTALMTWHPTSYDSDYNATLGSFNPLAGTLEPQQWRRKMDLGLHAVDILRNLTHRDPKHPINEVNTRYLAETFPDIIPILIRGLKTPDTHHFAEFKKCCLEVIDAVTRVIDIEDELELIDMIWEKFLDNDVTTLTLKLGIMVNLSLRDKTEHMRNVPASVLNYLDKLLMSGDDRILIACLDFFYHCTLLDDMVIEFTHRPDAFQKLFQLVRLMSHGTIRIPPEQISGTAKASQSTKKPVPQVTPDLPSDLLNDILKLVEPQRAIWWYVFTLWILPTPQDQN
ncbi:hypothetical protein ABW20_dc0105392 [Dactylellina cionopaga]|nr:hypothetical protein ABW20_dc0105392 [Dactylellina cionopaga]